MQTIRSGYRASGPSLPSGRRWRRAPDDGAQQGLGDPARPGTPSRLRPRAALALGERVRPERPNAPSTTAGRTCVRDRARLRPLRRLVVRPAGRPRPRLPACGSSGRRSVVRWAPRSGRSSPRCASPRSASVRCMPRSGGHRRVLGADRSVAYDGHTAGSGVVGNARALGARDRGFESRLPDHPDRAGTQRCVTPRSAVRTRWSARQRAPAASGLPPTPHIHRAGSARRTGAATAPSAGSSHGPS